MERSGEKRGRAARIRRSLGAYWPFYLMMLPGLVYIFINNYLPMTGLVLAFKKMDYSLGIYGSPWTGLDNFQYLFGSPDAFVIFRNTLCYNLAFIVLSTVFAVLVAVLLAEVRSRAARRVYQTVILVPHLISMVVVSYLAYAFLSRENGFLNNSVLALLGGAPVSWYTEPKYWPAILVIVYLWKMFGYVSIMYFATVIGIDRTYYEAAVVDGAGAWRQALHITLPCLRPTIVTMVLLQVGRMFYSDFGLFYQVPMNSGMLFPATNTIDTYVYRSLIELNDIGRSGAAGFLQSVLGFAVILGANAIVRRVERDNALF